MEKILDFKKGEAGDSPSKYYRFQCDCLEAADAMGIDVDACGKNDEGKFITIRMDFHSFCLWDRIIYAWQILRGDWHWREFIPRQNDYKHLRDIFDPKKKYSQLP
jgi:hypothetical protein